MVLRGEILETPTYDIIRTITEGNSGVCYLAYHDIFCCQVVQKTVSLLGLDDALAFSEPYRLYQLRHDHIAKILEAQWDPDLKAVKGITFVMPYYPGGSLAAALINGQRFSIGESIRVARHVLAALHHMHVEAALVHRDVKPGNVFLSEDLKDAYLGDLGSAAALDGSGQAEARGGTPLYHPPETQASGYYTVKSDLYGVGFILLEMINGALPYPDLDWDDVDARLRQGRKPLSSQRLEPAPHSPPELTRLINRLLDPNPDRRPIDARSTLTALLKISHLDWRESTEADVRVWSGNAVGSKPPRERRLYEVRAREVHKGPHAGMFELTARWKTENSPSWRQLRSLTTKVKIDQRAAWRDFFRSVNSAAAQFLATH